MADQTISAKAKIGATVVILDGIPFPIPSNSKIIPIFPKKSETLNGKIRMDATKRKYQYEIHWRFIPVVDYNNLERIANSLEDINLTYERYPQSQNGVLVKAELGERSHAALSGDGFYSNITVKLMEVSSRI